MLLHLSLLLCWTLCAAAPAAPEDDGPHILWKGQTAQILRVQNGQLQTEIRKSPVRIDLPGIAPEPLSLPGKPHPKPMIDGPEPERILAISDVHGNFEGLRALLRAQKVMNEQGRWTFGKGHVVICGDIFDRGPRQTECLWLLRSLETQAPRAGGKLHVLAGNHEYMILSGDLRYQNPRYPALPYTGGISSLYGPDSELGRWLRARPVVLRLGPWLFVHGGISPDLLKAFPNLEVIEKERQRVMGLREFNRKEVFTSPEGPTWYRGLVPGAHRAGDASQEHVQAVLKCFKVKALIIGHTTHEHITPYFDGKVLAVDAGLMNQLPGEALILEKGKIYRGTADGQREPLTPSQALKPAA